MDWQSILIALIGSGVLSTILVTSKDVWMAWFQKKKKSDNEKAKLYLQNRLNIYDILNKVRAKVKSPRALILFTENSGGLPTLGSQLYVSIIYESTDSEMESIKDDIQHLLTDEAYDNMLSTLVEQGEFGSNTKDLECGMLKSYYESSDVAQTYIVPILQTETKFYYMSVSWTDESVNPSNLKIHIKSAANNIRQLLQNNM